MERQPGGQINPRESAYRLTRMKSKVCFWIGNHLSIAAFCAERYLYTRRIFALGDLTQGRLRALYYLLLLWSAICGLMLYRKQQEQKLSGYQNIILFATVCLAAFSIILYNIPMLVLEELARRVL